MAGTLRDASMPGLRLVDSAGEWDGLLEGFPNAHLLQSARWAALKGRYGWTSERFLAATDGGRAAAQVLWRRTPLGPIGYVPRGPALEPGDCREAVRLLLDGMHRSARARKAVFLKVEPNSLDAALWPALGFRPAADSIQPTATLVLDLDDGLDTLKMRQLSKTRYNIGLAERKSVQVRRGGVEDLRAFDKLVRETGQRDAFAVRPLRYYQDLLEVLGDRAELLLAEHEGDLLAGIIVARFGQESIYLYGASGNHKRNLMPTYLLQWEAIRRAKEQGLARYDFWGVPREVAEDAEKMEDDKLPVAREHDRGDWWGIYRFKRGFGGRLQLYAEGFDYVYNPLAYFAWTRALPHVRRLLRRSQGVGD